jgi:hypothetical protein
MKKKLDGSSMSPTEGTSHQPDKDVCTVWPSISMQLPRSSRQPSSSYNSSPPRPPTGGPPPLLSRRKPYFVPTSPTPASPLLTLRSFASASLNQKARTPRNVPLAIPPSLSQTTPTNATWLSRGSSPIANRSSERRPSFLGSDSESPVIDKWHIPILLSDSSLQTGDSDDLTLSFGQPPQRSEGIQGVPRGVLQYGRKVQEAQPFKVSFFKWHIKRTFPRSVASCSASIYLGRISRCSEPIVPRK